MVRKSHGFKRGTRNKFKSDKNRSITRFLKKFAVGDPVRIKIEATRPTVHHRFEGKFGKVIGVRGSAYVVQIKDGTRHKQLILKPEHLRK